MYLGYVVKYTKVCLGSVKQVRNTTNERDFKCTE